MVSNFDQSEARKHRFLASDWSKFENLPRKYRTLLGPMNKFKGKRMDSIETQQNAEIQEFHRFLQNFDERLVFTMKRDLN